MQLQDQYLKNKSNILPLTCSNALLYGSAVGGCGGLVRGPTDSSEAEGVKTSREHSLQDSASRRLAVVRINDRQLVLGSPLQVEVIIVRTYWTIPGDLQGCVGDSPEQEGGRGVGSWREGRSDANCYISCCV